MTPSPHCAAVRYTLAVLHLVNTPALVQWLGATTVQELRRLVLALQDNLIARLPVLYHTQFASDLFRPTCSWPLNPNSANIHLNFCSVGLAQVFFFIYDFISQLSREVRYIRAKRWVGTQILASEVWANKEAYRIYDQIRSLLSNLGGRLIDVHTPMVYTVESLDKFLQAHLQTALCGIVQLYLVGAKGGFILPSPTYMS
jgi:hypothetical protein